MLAIKYAGGVMIAADTLGAYGATKRYKSVSRIVKAAPTTLVGAGGEISDFRAWRSVPSPPHAPLPPCSR